MMQIWVFLILIVIFIIVFAQFPKKVYERITDKDVLCESSVKAQSLLNHLNVGNFRKELRCELKEVKIAADLAGESGQREAKFGVANEMRNCWDRFGKGKLDLFGETGKFCSVCSRIMFSDRKNSLKGLYHFMYSEQVPGTGISYAEYLQGYSTGGAASLLGAMGQDGIKQMKQMEIPSEDDLAVLFVYVKGVDELRNFAKAAGSKAAGVFLGFGIYKSAGIVTLAPVPGARVAAAAIAATGVAVSVFGAASDSMQYLLQWIGVIEKERPEWFAYTYLVPASRNVVQEFGCEVIKFK